MEKSCKDNSNFGNDSLIDTNENMTDTFEKYIVKDQLRTENVSILTYDKEYENCLKKSTKLNKTKNQLPEFRGNKLAEDKNISANISEEWETELYSNLQHDVENGDKIKDMSPYTNHDTHEKPSQRNGRRFLENELEEEEEEEEEEADEKEKKKEEKEEKEDKNKYGKNIKKRGEFYGDELNSSRNNGIEINYTNVNYSGDTSDANLNFIDTNNISTANLGFSSLKVLQTESDYDTDMCNGSEKNTGAYREEEKEEEEEEEEEKKEKEIKKKKKFSQFENKICNKKEMKNMCSVDYKYEEQIDEFSVEKKNGNSDENEVTKSHIHSADSHSHIQETSEKKHEHFTMLAPKTNEQEGKWVQRKKEEKKEPTCELYSDGINGKIETEETVETEETEEDSVHKKLDVSKSNHGGKDIGSSDRDISEQTEDIFRKHNIDISNISKFFNFSKHKDEKIENLLNPQKGNSYLFDNMSQDELRSRTSSSDEEDEEDEQDEENGEGDRKEKGNDLNDSSYIGNISSSFKFLFNNSKLGSHRINSEELKNLQSWSKQKHMFTTDSEYKSDHVLSNDTNYVTEDVLTYILPLKKGDKLNFEAFKRCFHDLNYDMTNVDIRLLFDAVRVHDVEKANRKRQKRKEESDNENGIGTGIGTGTGTGNKYVKEEESESESETEKSIRRRSKMSQVDYVTVQQLVSFMLERNYKNNNFCNEIIRMVIHMNNILLLQYADNRMQNVDKVLFQLLFFKCASIFNDILPITHAFDNIVAHLTQLVRNVLHNKCPENELDIAIAQYLTEKNILYEKNYIFTQMNKMPAFNEMLSVEKEKTNTEEASTETYTKTKKTEIHIPIVNQTDGGTQETTLDDTILSEPPKKDDDYEQGNQKECKDNEEVEEKASNCTEQKSRDNDDNQKEKEEIAHKPKSVEASPVKKHLKNNKPKRTKEKACKRGKESKKTNAICSTSKIKVKNGIANATVCEKKEMETSGMKGMKKTKEMFEISEQHRKLGKNKKTRKERNCFTEINYIKEIHKNLEVIKNIESKRKLENVPLSDTQQIGSTTNVAIINTTHQHEQNNYDGPDVMYNTIDRKPHVEEDFSEKEKEQKTINTIINEFDASEIMEEKGIPCNMKIYKEDINDIFHRNKALCCDSFVSNVASMKNNNISDVTNHRNADEQQFLCNSYDPSQNILHPVNCDENYDTVSMKRDMACSSKAHTIKILPNKINKKAVQPEEAVDTGDAIETTVENQICDKGRTQMTEAECTQMMQMIHSKKKNMNINMKLNMNLNMNLNNLKVISAPREIVRTPSSAKHAEISNEQTINQKNDAFLFPAHTRNSNVSQGGILFEENINVNRITKGNNMFEMEYQRAPMQFNNRSIEQSYEQMPNFRDLNSLDAKHNVAKAVSSDLFLTDLTQHNLELLRKADESIKKTNNASIRQGVHVNHFLQPSISGPVEGTTPINNKARVPSIEHMSKKTALCEISNRMDILDNAVKNNYLSPENISKVINNYKMSINQEQVCKGSKTLTNKTKGTTSTSVAIELGSRTGNGLEKRKSGVPRLKNAEKMECAPEYAEMPTNNPPGNSEGKSTEKSKQKSTEKSTQKSTGKREKEVASTKESKPAYIKITEMFSQKIKDFTKRGTQQIETETENLPLENEIENSEYRIESEPDLADEHGPLINDSKIRGSNISTDSSNNGMTNKDITSNLNYNHVNVNVNTFNEQRDSLVFFNESDVTDKNRQFVKSAFDRLHEIAATETGKKHDFANSRHVVTETNLRNMMKKHELSQNASAMCYMPYLKTAHSLATMNKQNRLKGMYPMKRMTIGVDANADTQHTQNALHSKDRNIDIYNLSIKKNVKKGDANNKTSSVEKKVDYAKINMENGPLPVHMNTSDEALATQLKNKLMNNHLGIPSKDALQSLHYRINRNVPNFRRSMYEANAYSVKAVNANIGEMKRQNPSMTTNMTTNMANNMTTNMTTNMATNMTTNMASNIPNNANCHANGKLGTKIDPNTNSAFKNYANLKNNMNTSLILNNRNSFTGETNTDTFSVSKMNFPQNAYNQLGATNMRAKTNFIANTSATVRNSPYMLQEFMKNSKMREKNGNVTNAVLKDMTLRNDYLPTAAEKFKSISSACKSNVLMKNNIHMLNAKIQIAKQKAITNSAVMSKTQNIQPGRETRFIPFHNNCDQKMKTQFKTFSVKSNDMTHFTNGRNGENEITRATTLNGIPLLMSGKIGGVGSIMTKEHATMQINTGCDINRQNLITANNSFYNATADVSSNYNLQNMSNLNNFRGQPIAQPASGSHELNAPTNMHGYPIIDENNIDIEELMKIPGIQLGNNYIQGMKICADWLAENNYDKEMVEESLKQNMLGKNTNLTLDPSEYRSLQTETLHE